MRLSKSTFYHQPVAIDAKTLTMMKDIYRGFMKDPFFG